VPHGGGGPGAGPVGVSPRLVEFLPKPLMGREGERYFLDYDVSHSIGKVKLFYGQIGALIRAWVYIRSLGLSGLKQVSRDAILNANYLKKKLEGHYTASTPGFCMHEFVLDLKKQADQFNVHAGEVGKRLLDFGFHAPTVHFPLIVHEALMIEPTETESKETLDSFVEAMLSIFNEIQNDTSKVKSAPHTLPVKKCDDVQAARKPELNYFQSSNAPTSVPIQ
jgi:glycine dehydrogenase subunit 2